MVGTGATLKGRYRIVREIGRGGMGVVFEAVDSVLDRVVAIKLVTASHRAASFAREAKIAARLEHPGIVAVYDFGDEAGESFLVMQHVHGSTLRDVLDRATVTTSFTLKVAAGLLRALGYSHASGIVHRDIKPENVMISFDDRGQPLPRLMDFGIAKSLTDGAQTGQIAGTPLYLAPEQAAGGAVDTRSDLYAVGVVLYECLAGVTPIRGDTVLTTLTRLLTEDPPPLSTHVPEIPPELEALVMRALSRDAAQRPQTAEAFAAQVDALHARLTTTHPDLALGPPSARSAAVTLDAAAAPDVALLETHLDDLARASELAGPAPARTMPAEHLLEAAELAHRLGHAEEALARARDGVRACETSWPAHAAAFEAVQVNVLAELGQLSAATETLGGARRRLDGERVRTATPGWLLARLHRAEGNLACARGEIERAAVAFDAALVALEAAPDTFDVGVAAFNAADARARLGDHDAARSLLLRAEQVKRALGDRWGMAYVAWVRARMAHDVGPSKVALELAQDGLSLARLVGDLRIRALLQLQRGVALAELEDLVQAECALVEAHVDAARCQATDLLAAAQAKLSMVALGLGDVPRARNLAIDALFRADQHEAREAAIHARIAVASSDDRSLPARHAFLDEAAELAQSLGDPFRQLEVLAARATISRDPLADRALFDRAIDAALQRGCARIVAPLAVQLAEAAQLQDQRAIVGEYAEIAATACHELGMGERAQRAAELAAHAGAH